MKVLGNIIWMLLGGLVSALLNFLVGVILCITIIGIPFGKQCFKVAKLMLAPFGKEVTTHFDSHPVINVLWLIFVGLAECIGFFFMGILLCITIIGIPFGKQWFKLAKLILIPFGATVN